MSRIGRLPIPIPDGVEIEVQGQRVIARGKSGQLEWTVAPGLNVVVDGRTVRVQNPNPNKYSNGLWGTTRTLIHNMCVGIKTGYSKSLEIVGTGYRAELKGRTLVMELGFDHPVEYTVPEGIDAAITARPMRIVLKSIDKERLGQIAAEIRAIKPPEPYHGKGIRYVDENVRRKAGKAGA
jgi:large subunit ribosomal protein L6